MSIFIVSGVELNKHVFPQRNQRVPELVWKILCSGCPDVNVPPKSTIDSCRLRICLRLQTAVKAQHNEAAQAGRYVETPTM